MMQIELPADVAIGLNAIWGEGLFSVQYREQLTRLAPRRVTDMNGNMVVCHGDMVTTALYSYSVDLVPCDAGKPQPSPADITQQHR